MLVLLSSKTAFLFRFFGVSLRRQNHFYFESSDRNCSFKPVFPVKTEVSSQQILVAFYLCA